MIMQTTPEARDTLKEPKVSGFKIDAKMLKSAKDIVSSLYPLSFVEVVEDSGSVVVLNVESRDLRREPYLFSTIYLRPDSMEVVYSITPDTSMRKRKIEVYRHVLNVLSMIAESYSADAAQLYQQLQFAMQEITEFASSDYADIFAKYDVLQGECAEAKQKLVTIEESNSKVSREIIELRAENDELTLRARQLEGYSNEALMAKIQDWLDVHRNEINVTEFAKQYNLMEARVEEILNQMVIRGYLERRG